MTHLFRIDMHTHAFPRAFLERLSVLEDDVVLRALPDGRRIALWNKAPLPEFSLEARLASMNAEGVRCEVLSAPPVYGTFGPSTAELCSLMNDLQRDICRAAPGRFYAFIHLPYHDAEQSLVELKRCRQDPCFVGVTLASNLNGAYPDASLDWLWEACVALDLPLFVHPVAPVGVQSPISLPLVHFPGDTTVFASSMILSGTFERFPQLRVILAHFGGSLSVLGSRLDMITHPHFPPHAGLSLPRKPSEYIRHFYVDAAQGFNRAAYLAALEAFGCEHILYGTDYFLLDTPWRRDLNTFLDAQPESLAALDAIMRRNAQRILSIPSDEPPRTETAPPRSLATL